VPSATVGWLMHSPNTWPDCSPISAAPLQVTGMNNYMVTELHCDAGKATGKAAFSV